MKCAAMYTLWGLLLVSLNAAEPYLAKVVRIKDGDTIEVIDAAQRLHHVRLAEIDAPEKGQDFSQESEQNLSGYLLDRTVQVAVSSVDRYQREVASIWLNEVNVNYQQVADGLAWQYKTYSDSQTLADLEQQAREKRRGLWSQAQPTPPWEHRSKRFPKAQKNPRPDPNARSPQRMVKKSRKDICHTFNSPHYRSTTKFTLYPNLGACLKSGGRVAKQ